MFVYLIANHVSGKYYVGQHKGNDLKHYLQQKLCAAWHYKGRSHLFAAMMKYPRDSWSIHALRADIQTREELDQTERDFIKFLRAQDPEFGYNICRGGEGFTGSFSEKSRQKYSLSMKEVWKRPNYREKMTKRKGRLGSKASEETLEKLRTSHLGIRLTPEAIQKRTETRRLRGIPSPNFGKSSSEETRRKMRESHLLRWVGKRKKTEVKRAYHMTLEHQAVLKEFGRSNFGNHQRWHVNRGLVVMGCQHCQNIGA